MIIIFLSEQHIVLRYLSYEPIELLWNTYHFRRVSTLSYYCIISDRDYSGKYLSTGVSYILVSHTSVWLIKFSRPNRILIPVTRSVQGMSAEVKELR